VAARAWLKKQGFKITLTGGDVLVVPTANAEQFQLFSQGKLDAVWTVEPWSRGSNSTPVEKFTSNKPTP